MTSRPTPIAYGMTPWHQTSWDARAAGNFIGGGSGSGLLLFTIAAGASGALRTTLLLAGIALVALGLASVGLELGRPLRGINVFRNPRTSWMSREAIAAVALVAFGVATLAGVPAAPLLALAAAVFMYCQARLVRAARGIPAWREPTIVPVLVATALAEGAGLYCLIAGLQGGLTAGALGACAVLLLVRGAALHLYRERMAGVKSRANAALAATLRWVLVAGTIAPLALLAVALVVPAAAMAPVAVLAGLAAAAAGWLFKLVLVTRAGFNSGFALPVLPVRGARR